LNRKVKHPNRRSNAIEVISEGTEDGAAIENAELRGTFGASGNRLGLRAQTAAATACRDVKKLDLVSVAAADPLAGLVEPGTNEWVQTVHKPFIGISVAPQHRSQVGEGDDIRSVLRPRVDAQPKLSLEKKHHSSAVINDHSVNTLVA
jgi:hypothetical protein